MTTLLGKKKGGRGWGIVVFGAGRGVWCGQRGPRSSAEPSQRVCHICYVTVACGKCGGMDGNGCCLFALAPVVVPDAVAVGLNIAAHVASGNATIGDI